jgi:hypothetical protein
MGPVFLLLFLLLVLHELFVLHLLQVVQDLLLLLGLLLRQLVQKKLLLSEISPIFFIIPPVMQDARCLSRILIFIHPGFPISDPGPNKSNKRGGKQVVVLPFLLLFDPINSQKYGFGNRDPEKPIPEKKASDPGSGSPTLLISACRKTPTGANSKRYRTHRQAYTINDSQQSLQCLNATVAYSVSREFR